MSSLALVSLASLGGEQADTPQNTRESGSHITTSGEVVSLSVQPVAQGATTRLNIEWSGQKPDSILVVSFDVPGYYQATPMPFPLAGHVELWQPIVLRKIGSQGKDTVDFKNENMIAYLGNSPEFIISVRVVDYISIDVLVPDPGIKGIKRRRRTHRSEAIKEDNAPSDLRFITPPDPEGRPPHVFPDLQPFVIQDVPEGGHLKGFVPIWAQRAHVRVTLAPRTE